MRDSITSNSGDRKRANATAKPLNISLEEIEFLLQFAASPEEKREVAEYLAELTGHRVPWFETICKKL